MIAKIKFVRGKKKPLIFFYQSHFDCIFDALKALICAPITQIDAIYYTFWLLAFFSQFHFLLLNAVHYQLWAILATLFMHFPAFDFPESAFCNLQTATGTRVVSAEDIFPFFE